MHSTFAVVADCIIAGVIGIVVGAVGTVKVILWADGEQIKEARQREYDDRNGRLAE